MNIDVSGVSLPVQQFGDINLNNDNKNKNTIFDDFYNAAIGLYDQTNNLQVKAEQFQLDFASGKTDDMLGAILANGQALTAIQFTSQITSKVLEAYKEILRIQM